MKAPQHTQQSHSQQLPNSQNNRFMSGGINTSVPILPSNLSNNARQLHAPQFDPISFIPPTTLSRSAYLNNLSEIHKAQLTILDQENNVESNIKNVWVYNFEEELAKISALLETYPFVAVDTEFPGTVIDEVNSGPRDMREYLRIKANADILKIIQLGVTISDAQGRLPSPVSTWQFNFDFNIDTEKKNQVSIQLLQDHGIDFGQLKQHGISPQYFAEKFIQSGLVLNDQLTWICFHGSYDFAYIMKILIGEKLPQTRDLFETYMKLFFPKLLDIRSFTLQFNLSGGLDKLALQLGVKRVGNSHQAGSDSLVTLQVFFSIYNDIASEKERRDILEQFNQDVYGYSNHQAYPPQVPSGRERYLEPNPPGLQDHHSHQQEQEQQDFYNYGGLGGQTNTDQNDLYEYQRQMQYQQFQIHDHTQVQQQFTQAQLQHMQYLLDQQSLFGGRQEFVMQQQQQQAQRQNMALWQQQQQDQTHNPNSNPYYNQYQS